MVHESQPQVFLYYLGLSIVRDRNRTRISLTEIALGIVVFQSEEEVVLPHITQFLNLCSVCIPSLASVIQSFGFNS